MSATDTALFDFTVTDTDECDTYFDGLVEAPDRETALREIRQAMNVADFIDDTDGIRLRFTLVQIDRRPGVAVSRWRHIGEPNTVPGPDRGVWVFDGAGTLVETILPTT